MKLETPGCDEEILENGDELILFFAAQVPDACEGDPETNTSRSSRRKLAPNCAILRLAGCSSEARPPARLLLRRDRRAQGPSAMFLSSKATLGA